jgi:tripartite-type tricarboxylate transporter receptor subunit TctC
MWRKASLLFILSMVLVGSLFIRATEGKEYPSQPIEIYCPYLAGSSMDITARVIADVAPKYLGQPMVVVNKAGASGSLCAAEVIRSKPDGYKLAILANLFFASTVHTQKITFDPNDLIPIANFMQYKLGIAVKADSPWKTLADILDYAKKNPGKLKWAHAGRGTSLFTYTRMIFKKAGIEAVDVPYPGSPQQTAALLGGHVDISAAPYGAQRGAVKAGRIRFVVMFTDERFDDPSDVPSVTEAGFPEAAKLPTVVGLYAHKDTPKEITKTLFDAFKKTYDDPDFKKGLGKLGEQPRFGGPEFMTEAIKNAEEVSVPLLKEFGLYVGK